MRTNGERPLPGQALWHLLQISDQFFPTGAYAFSHALETYIALGLVHDRASCQGLLEQLCHNALGPCDLVCCAAAFRLAAAGNLTALVELDWFLEALKLPRELRLESRHTGQAFVRAALALQPSAWCQAWYEQVRQDATPGHHAVAFGVVSQALGLALDEALLAFLYNVTAGLVAAAVRLVPLGQTDGQRVLHDLAPTLLTALQMYRDAAPEDAWSCTPGLEVRSMQHERLYSRLCRS